MAINPGKQALTLLEEFKNFAFKGNIVDLTVGFIIGAGFTAVVKSAVDNVVMPLISLVLPSKAGFDGMFINIGGTLAEGKTGISPADYVGGANLFYGKFIGDLIVFIVTAFVVFIVIVKFLRLLMRSKQAAAPAPPPPPPAPTKEEQLLTEIRDLLKASAKSS
ncbi:MAG: large conductance mechanosensitive channel protein MscL [Tepidisphaerales bacterium]